MENIQLGDTFNLGIGSGESALFEIIKIIDDFNEDFEPEKYAILEMVDFGGPHQKHSLAYLSKLNKGKE